MFQYSLPADYYLNQVGKRRKYRLGFIHYNFQDDIDIDNDIFFSQLFVEILILIVIKA